MSGTLRSYDHARNRDAIGWFLLRTYDVGARVTGTGFSRVRSTCTLIPRWIPSICPTSASGRIEDRGDIVGIVHYEHRMGINASSWIHDIRTSSERSRPPPRATGNGRGTRRASPCG